MSAQHVVIDTNVIIDAFVRSHDVRSRSSIDLLKRVERGEFTGVLPTPVLVEVFYVVLDVTHDPVRAGKVVRSLMALPNMVTWAVERNHAMLAIDLIKESNYFRMGDHGKLGRRSEGLSMVDALILAIGRSIPDSIVCSNESKFSHITGVVVKKPWEMVSQPEELPASLSAGTP